MFEKFSYPKIFGSIPGCPKHWGVILKSKKMEMALGHFHWDQKELFGGKTKYQKSCETVPLRQKVLFGKALKRCNFFQ